MPLGDGLSTSLPQQWRELKLVHRPRWASWQHGHDCQWKHHRGILAVEFYWSAEQVLKISGMAPVSPYCWRFQSDIQDSAHLILADLPVWRWFAKPLARVEQLGSRHLRQYHAAHTTTTTQTCVRRRQGHPKLKTHAYCTAGMFATSKEGKCQNLLGFSGWEFWKFEIASPYWLVASPIYETALTVQHA